MLIAQFPGSGHGNVVRRDSSRDCPPGSPGDFEVFERFRPRLHGVGAQRGIPMQRVDRKTAARCRRKYFRNAHSFHVRLRAELHARKSQCHHSPNCSSERRRAQVGNHQTPVVQPVAAPPAKALRPENVVLQIDVRRDKASRSLRFPAGKRTFPAHVHLSLGSVRRTQRAPEIQKIHPSSVAVAPLGVGEIRHFGLHVKPRAPRSDLRLFNRQAFAPKRESRRNTQGNRNIAALCQLHRLPIECPQIQRTRQTSTRIQSQPQIVALHR